MATIISFSDHHRISAVAAISGARRMAAIRRKSSALTPAATPSGEATIADQNASGILRRCHHLLTCHGVAPSDAAHSSLVGQSSMMERNEAIFDMRHLLGQSVLKCKANVSHDYDTGMVQNFAMASSDSGTLYKTAFLARIRKAREDRRMTQSQAAELLGIKQDKYKQYETRSLMPHELIPRFCLIFSVSTDWLLTGKLAATMKKTTIEKVKARRSGTG